MDVYMLQNYLSVCIRENVKPDGKSVRSLFEEGLSAGHIEFGALEPGQDGCIWKRPLTLLDFSGEKTAYTGYIAAPDLTDSRYADDLGTFDRYLRIHTGETQIAGSLIGAHGDPKEDEVQKLKEPVT